MPYLYKPVPVEQQAVTGFVCDCCKKTHDADNFVEMQELLHWKNTGGYGSVWGDGVTVEVTLCQACTHALFKEFASVTLEAEQS